MELISESKVVVQKSKFFGYLYKIGLKDEIGEIVKEVLGKNKKARHICYGGFVKGEDIVKNDGEVGSPGKVLLQLLKSEGFDNHILIVARIFGGVKLGVGGVSRAFRECGQKAMNETP